MKKWLLLILSWAAIISNAAMGATWNIVYPRPLTDADQRTQYPVKLLTVALEQTGVKYKLSPSDRILLQRKALSLLAENRSVNVVWSMTDKQREADLRAIRIPIYKGLSGWRLLLANDTNQVALSQITSIDQLRNFRAIQGHDWPDTKILQSNGFEVLTSKSYLNLFYLLEQGKGDFFPRSVTEIWTELSTEDIDSSIGVTDAIGIRYPTAMYFFVNKRDTTLARLIEDGLEKAIASGKFDQLFEQIYQPVLTRSGMAQRRFFQLDNPLLPKATPLHRKELWYLP